MKKQELKKNVKTAIQKVVKSIIKPKIDKKLENSKNKSKKTTRSSEKMEKTTTNPKKKVDKSSEGVKKSSKKTKIEKKIKKIPLKREVKEKKSESKIEEIIIVKKKIYNIPINKENITMIVSELVGDDALNVVFYLKGKKDVSEFKIADDTEIEIHAVRNILYRLNSKGMVSYIRKKDKEKGWYISYWTFLDDKVPEIVYKLKESKLNKFKERLEKEESNKGNFYLCPSGCVRMDFDNAVDTNFKCLECGSLLNQQDNHRTIEGIKENIEKLEKELKEYKNIV